MGEWRPQKGNAMRATVYHHPSARIELKDPRDPEVQSLYPPAQDGYALPQPGVSDPIIAAPPSVDEEPCIGCGVAIRHHYSLDRKRWTGCTGALGKQTPPRNPERWNDPMPGITCEVRAALMLHCGPAMEIHCAVYGHDELLAVAMTLAQAAIKAYRREMGQ